MKRNDSKEMETQGFLGLSLQIQYHKQKTVVDAKGKY